MKRKKDVWICDSTRRYPLKKKQICSEYNIGHSYHISFYRKNYACIDTIKYHIYFWFWCFLP
ncbi:hypothetical protein MtrunA17_Chr6g0458721 [Medicago truncatula]|uniref:Uncharacterized protein n=1 Tax=Medicago truncatula TaxID=3880 RepID=A0A396HGZ4_MEDTR|nr:hypothetical protein MtrunA17_Chr6g0458721 [Medicago truncatula]